MKATHFRAYGKVETISRRDTNEGKLNLAHDVHDVVAEGKLKDGVAELKEPAEYVAFYSGTGDEQVCLGRVDGPFKAGSSVEYVEPEADAIGEGEVIVDGQTYRKAE